ncbi:hypothetical protein [Brachybacterium sp. AOP29-B2-41]|uniref:hypothetical protein n=1 Tax=Brachybacterium sp. AOP29-B2-41 TaxID=3457704 RepID=UPI0040346A3B
MTTRWIKNLTALLAGAALALGAAPALATPSEPAPAPAPAPVAAARSGTPHHTTMLGDFAAPIYHEETSPEGVKLVNAEATLDALEEAKVNTYAYPIFGLPHYGDGTAGPLEITQSQWDRMPEFADAAAERGIDVYPYLVPPSIGALDTSVPRPEQEPGIAPFGWDYIAWAEETAKLSKEHPNIGGLFIDDFDSNTLYHHSPYSFAFTPEYVEQMSAAAKQHNPDFTIHGVVYYQSLEVASHFRGALDGVVFPYRAHTGDPGTADASKVREEGEVYGDLTHCLSGDTCLQLASFAEAPSNSAATASTSVDVTDGEQHELQIALNHDNYLPTCEDGSCYQFSVPNYTPTANGDYTAISQEVTVTGDGPHRLSFWTGAVHGSLAGYHVLEALVNGEVVASRDVNDPAGPKGFDVDVTAHVADGETATVTFRLHNAKGVGNYDGQIFLDDIALTGAEIHNASFDDPGSQAWATEQVGEAMSSGYTAGQHVVELLVDETVAASFPVGGYTRWSTHTADLTDALSGTDAAEVSVRLRTVGNDHARHVWVDDLSISGTSLVGEGFDDLEGWALDEADGTSAEQVESFDALFMLYASRLSSDVPGHQPSPEYIREVQAAGLAMVQEQFFDGSLIYVLNLSAPLDHPDGVERRIIGELHGDFLATDTATCDVVLTDDQRSLTVEEGRTCVIGADVHGSTMVHSGAELTIIDSEIRGQVTAHGSITLCGTDQGGSLNITGAPEVRIGATPELCAGNALRGSVTISDTAGVFTIAGTTARGSLECTGNALAPATRETTNQISGAAGGQCSAL